MSTCLPRVSATFSIRSIVSSIIALSVVLETNWLTKFVTDVQWHTLPHPPPHSLLHQQLVTSRSNSSSQATLRLQSWHWSYRITQHPLYGWKKRTILLLRNVSGFFRGAREEKLQKGEKVRFLLLDSLPVQYRDFEWDQRKLLTDNWFTVVCIKQFHRFNTLQWNFSPL